MTPLRGHIYLPEDLFDEINQTLGKLMHAVQLDVDVITIRDVMELIYDSIP